MSVKKQFLTASVTRKLAVHASVPSRTLASQRKGESAVAEVEGHGALFLAIGMAGRTLVNRELVKRGITSTTVVISSPVLDRATQIRFLKTLANTQVGADIVISGSEKDVYIARQIAIEAGAVEDELTLLITDSRLRQVYCPHCGAKTTTDQRIGQRVACAGCARSVIIEKHFSRTHASYLGVLDHVDNEFVDQASTTTDA